MPPSTRFISVPQVVAGQKYPVSPRVPVNCRDLAQLKWAIMTSIRWRYASIGQSVLDAVIPRKTFPTTDGSLDQEGLFHVEADGIARRFGTTSTSPWQRFDVRGRANLLVLRLTCDERAAAASRDVPTWSKAEPDKTPALSSLSVAEASRSVQGWGGASWFRTRIKSRGRCCSIPP